MKAVTKLIQHKFYILFMLLIIIFSITKKLLALGALHAGTRVVDIFENCREI